MSETLEYVIALSIVALLIIDFVTIIILIVVVNRQSLRLTVSEMQLHQHAIKFIDLESDVKILKRQTGKTT